MANPTQGTTPHPDRDVLHEIECALIDARRIPGALRAIHSLTFPWRSVDNIEVQNVERQDLGFLFEVVAAAAAQHLDKLDGLTHDLHMRHQPARKPQ